AFGAALSPPPGAPAAWIDETVAGVPRNIYGVTKTVAEDLCQLFHRQHGLPCVVLRTSRFFPEDDDSKVTREAFSGDNAKANEFLFRRVDLEDAVSAHLAAVDRAPSIGFGKYVVSATTPFQRGDLALLRTDPARVVEQLFPACRTIYAKRGFRMSPSIDRVYANGRARRDLAWNPRFDFARILGQLAADEPIGSALAREVGSKGYHDETFDDGPFPVE
ncbi:MAG: NAD(P)-dependent oxidoreductase, partial [Actinomycetota bacterium]